MKPGLSLFLFPYLLAASSLLGQSVEPAASDRWVHRSWSIEDGLPQNTVTALAQTPDGYLWIGMVKGVARFDGVRFEAFESANSPGLGVDRVRRLMVDDQGRLWIGGEQGGVSRYVDGRFENLSAGGLVPPGSSGAMAQSSDGSIWFTVAGRVFREVNGELAEFELARDGARFGPGALHVGTDGKLWMGTRTGLAYQQSDSLVFVDVPFDGRWAVRDIVDGDADGDGLWLVLRDGYGRWRDGELTYFPMPEARHLHRDGAGRLWLAATGVGIFRVFDDSLSTVGLPESLRGSFIRDFFEDDDGLLWIAGGDDGLHLISEPLFASFTPDDGLPGGSVLRVIEDAEGSIWTSTLALGAFKLGNGRFRQFSTDEGVPTPGVTYLATSGDGTQWLSSNGLGARFVNGRFERLPMHPSLVVGGAQRIKGMGPSSGGGMWLALPGRLVHFDGVDYSDPIPAPDLPQSSWPVVKEIDGDVWYAGSVGWICRYRDGGHECFNNDNGIPRAIVRDVHPNPDGSFWLGTYGGGLCNLDDGQARCITDEHGLPDNTVHRILEDNLGFVWMGSNKGIARVHRREIEAFFLGRAERVRPDIYDETDGMPSRECNEGGLLDSQGRVWFPTMGGLVAALPDDALRRAPSVPDVHVEEVDADGASLSPDSLLQLPAGSDRLEFRYTGISFRNPNAVRFRARLVGYDTGWRDMGSSRSATYTNLGHGEYAFEVQSASGSSEWSGSARASFSIAPFFYETWWFRLVAGLLVVGLLAVVYRSRVNRLIERERLAKSEAEARRLAELDAAKSRFFANISHEFRTPLTLIISPTEEALERGGLEPRELTRTQNVLKNARRLLDLIDRLLDLSSLEAGRLELSPADGDIAGFIREMVRRFQPLAERSRIELRFRSHLQERPTAFDHDRVQSIVGNLISNALKYTPEDGKVWVTLSETDDGGVETVVKDTGSGIPKDQLEQIFERYARGDDDRDAGSVGSGIGLALAKELVDLHGGVMLVESEEGFGTAFIVRLPLSRIDRPVDAAIELPDPPVDEAELDATEASPVSASSERSLVLVVEDNDDVRSLLIDQLSDQFDVVAASHGLEGLAKAMAHKPDIVLSDVMMPGIDGVELCRRMKSDPALADIPVVMLTAKVGDEHEIDALSAGADDYVAKPYNARALRQKLVHHIALRENLRQRYQRELVVPTTGRVVGSADESFARRLVEIVESRLSDPGFHVEELASEVGLSRRQLTRRSKAAIGEAPSDLLQRLRLERAASLLAARSGTVSEIAYQVGFKSVSHFGAVFKEAYGHTPGEHIENGT